MGKISIEEEGKWASTCNDVVNFLLEEGYQLTAFELLHELLEDGRHDHAIRLKNYFSDSELFPPDQIARFNNSKVADPQTLLEEKISTESKLALTEYDLRLAQEDVERLTLELQKQQESSPQEANGKKNVGPLLDVPLSDGPGNEKAKRDITLSSLGPLKNAEKRDLNCAVKEYLLFAGYRLTAMTFIDEVTDQNLDIWSNSLAFVSDALRRYYYQYLSSTSEAAEIRDLKQAMEIKRKELNDCQMEITALKMHIEGSRSGKTCLNPSESVDTNIKPVDSDPYSNSNCNFIPTEGSSSSQINKIVMENSSDGNKGTEITDSVSVTCNDDTGGGKKDESEDLFVTIPEEAEPLSENVQSSNMEMRIAIEHHPDDNVRDSLHMLFDLFKQPDEQQRRVIMDACANLAENIGEMRTETELLPQFWEQINHNNDERRLLVAQSCVELAGYVRPEKRDSLILPIVQQLVEDTAIVVREAAAHNLVLLLPLFPNLDKYPKVEELMFQLLCDPSDLVVDTALQELVPAIIDWGGKLDHVVHVLLSHILGSAQMCPPISRVEGSVDSYLRALGERERGTIDVLLRMLTKLLHTIYQKTVETCPFVPVADPPIIHNPCFSTTSLKLYATGLMEWPLFELLHTDCLHDLIKLATFLPQKEDNLRTRIVEFLLKVSELYGKHYWEHIMLPVLYVAIDQCDCEELTFLPRAVQSKVTGLQPKDMISQMLANMCVFPLLFAGILGSRWTCFPDAYLLNKVCARTPYGTTEFKDALRFLCTFEEHRQTISEFILELMESSDPDRRANAADLFKVLVPYMDVDMASINALPALVSLGSDHNLDVKCASMDAFRALAQHFNDEMVVGNMRILMDAYLEDGSHGATTFVLRGLVLVVPHTTDKLREYLLSKIFKLTSMLSQESNIRRRREKADAFCKAICALEATDISATNTRDFLLPSILNLLKEPDALDPEHKEALEIILSEQSDLTVESISSKVMGAHIGLDSSVRTFLGDSSLLGKKEAASRVATEQLSHEVVPVDPASQPPSQAALSPHDIVVRRIFGIGLEDMLQGEAKGVDESPE